MTDIQETDGQTIARLAALTLLEYDRIRKDEALRLEVSVGALDNEVRQKRASLRKDMAGRAEMFVQPELWPEEVPPTTLLDDIAALFKRYAVLPPHADTALALWVCFTWCIDEFKVAPIMALSSPEKRCGKTTVLSLLNRLVNRPLPTANILPATLFRAVEKWHPTILIDEADCFLKESDELRGILNSGHTRTSAFVLRCVGDDHEPTRFSTWGAKAIALIGSLPDTLHDRSIIVELRRKLTGEHAEKFRHADDTIFDELTSKLARFAVDNAETLRRARPAALPDISDRATDNWEPLMAIAEVAGTEWHAKAIKAAKALSGLEADAPSIGVELLADIQEAFESKHVDRIASTELINALCSDEEKPWTTYNRGKPISPRQFSRRLKEYHISNKPIKIGYETVRGFDKLQFQDAFLRYLSPPSGSVTPLQPTETASNTVTDKLLHNTYTGQSVTTKPASSFECNRITDFTPSSGNTKKIVEVEL